MKKKLVEASNVESYLCENGTKIYIDKSMVLTPGARDVLNGRRVEFIYGERPGSEGSLATILKGCASANAFSAVAGNENGDYEKFVLGIGAMLKDSYGIVDPAERKRYTKRAIQIIKENI
ncbi:hypothetical protein [Desulfotalea psychrophila]|uniref:Uncharacterized protein n=1 Tax=Desulfotalea psychrophila (strain LSv54 / DSM 12343) TaxID=177439 RepID=Q6AM70_DESPS|nr:hypothetical protein [Desulfotalea psychrophila]CAG36555.1 unknown protein [Desulfotalea psychrophila LSv54]